MERATLAAVATVALVATAGCTSSVPTATPAPVPSVGADERAVEGPLPPGVDPSGTVDGERLLAAHVTAVGDSDGRIEINRTVRRTDGLLLRAARTNVSLDADPPTVLFRQVLESGSVYPGQAVDAYYSDRGRYARIDDGNETRYDRITATTVEEYRNQTAVYEVRNALARGEWAATGTGQVDGDRVVVLRLVGTGAGIENATGVIAVAPGGAIRRIDLTVETENERVIVDYSYDPLNASTISPPAWLEAARNATG